MMVLAVLFINSAFGFSDPYQTFLKFINESGSLKMSLEFYQIQYGDHFDTAGDFYYLRDQYYFFDDAVQRIIFQDDEIFTISKINKQIILDNIIPGEVTIFDILSGEKNNFSIRFLITYNFISKTLLSLKSWFAFKKLILQHFTQNVISSDFNVKSWILSNELLWFGEKCKIHNFYAKKERMYFRKRNAKSILRGDMFMNWKYGNCWFSNVADRPLAAEKAVDSLSTVCPAREKRKFYGKVDILQFST